MALIPDMDLLRICELCFRIDLVGDWSPRVDCLRMDRFAGEGLSGLSDRSRLLALLFWTISTGTGLIMTLELFLLEMRSFSAAGGGPQDMSLLDLIISGAFLGEVSTFYLRRMRRFLMLLPFIILAISSSCLCFRRA